MKKVASLVLVAALVGCASDPYSDPEFRSKLHSLNQQLQHNQMAPYIAQCEKYGFTDGTSEMAACVQREYNRTNSRTVSCQRYDAGITCN